MLPVCQPVETGHPLATWVIKPEVGVIKSMIRKNCRPLPDPWAPESIVSATHIPLEVRAAA